jgi:K(+)-stimulated pyrophosphate-energized sodium pump
MFPTTDTFRVKRPVTSSTTAASPRIASIPRAFYLFILALITLATPMMAQEGGEANLKLPDLGSVSFLGGISGNSFLVAGMVVSALGLLFGLVMFMRLRNLPVHAAMREVSELISKPAKRTSQPKPSSWWDWKLSSR